MRKKKFMALPLLAIFALSVTGYAFASWAEEFTVNGIVNTGRLELTFTSIDGPFVTADPYGVASTTVTPSGPQTNPVKTVTMNVNNAYPGYKVKVTLEITNVGTIPADFKGFNLNSGPASYDSHLGRWTGSLPGGELTFIGKDGMGTQIPVGANVVYTLELDVNSAAQPSTNYAYTVGLVFEQGL